MEIKDFEKKDKLIEAALDEFTQKSYDEASLNNIIKNASMSKGSFYYHFKNKRDLYTFIYVEAGNVKLRFLDKELKNYEEEMKDKNIFEILKLYGHLGFKFAKEYPVYYQFGKRLLEEKNEELMTHLRKQFNHVTEDLMDNLIARAIERKEIRDDFPVDFTTRLIKNLFLSYDKVVLKDINEVELDELMKLYDNYLDFLQNGIGKK
ncbi:TetR/AcrR family transcriptional regulator [Wukongibacter baidiensis]|uniref:TetR/AcrR family transcriptional regulator n=1 Tax=Wukongibacter baidiensis TaxID=1723361 RepID=UPI003D7FCDB4